MNTAKRIGFSLAALTLAGGHDAEVLVFDLAA